MELVRAEANIIKKDCNLCGLRPVLCICGQIAPMPIKTRLSMVLHSTEMGRRTNSGQLAAKCLQGSRIFPYGAEWEQFDHQRLLQGPKPLLLYPDSETILSPDLINDEHEGPHLVIVDGNWRQARRIFQRLLRTGSFRWVSLPRETNGGYALRNSASRQGTVSTMEATAIALGILEGKPVEQHLRHYFELFLKGHMISRRGGNQP